MEVLRVGNIAEPPKVMKNCKTLVYTVLFPKWAFSPGTVWLVNRKTQRFKPFSPTPSAQ